MESQGEAATAAPSADALSAPVISDDGQLVAGFYEVERSGAKRIGFAVIDTADHLRAESLPAVSSADEAAVSRLRAAARNYLSRGQWRPMATPDRANFGSGRDSLRWSGLDLSVTVSEEGNLSFSLTTTSRVLGVTPFASTLIERRGCAFNMLYHNLVFNDIAGFDPRYRLAFLVFDVIEGNSDKAGFSPFRCDPSALVHVVQVALP